MDHFYKLITYQIYYYCIIGYFSVILTSDGEIFCAGCGKYGRLGQGNSEENSTLFKSLCLQTASGNLKFSKVKLVHWE